MLPQTLELLAQFDELQFVTLAAPHWKRPVGGLQGVAPASIKQWLRRRLKELNATDLLAVGGIEASLNVELDGTLVWAPHVHMIVGGASHAEITSALAIEGHPKQKSKWERPLVIKLVGNLGAQLGYCVKGHVVERVAYIGLNGRQHRKTNRLRASLLPEHDAWLASSTIGDRLILMGMRWYPNQRVLRRS